MNIIVSCSLGFDISCFLVCVMEGGKEVALTATMVSLRGSMTRMVLSLQAVQIRLPLRFQQALKITSGCMSSRVIMASPVLTSQTITWLSQPGHTHKH